ncbi:MAG: glycosyltransferase [Sphingobium sp.]|nr:MAG: glycosyltransferase [Sphingobium sp.]
MALRVLSLSTLYPSAASPNFGRFVELSLDAAEAVGGAEIVRMSPNGLPPWPMAKILPSYRQKGNLPTEDEWRGKRILRPRFTLFPGILPARNPTSIVRSMLPLVRHLHAQKPFDLIDAQFFWPDGPAAMAIAAELGLPFSVKARGADIHHWSTIDGCAPHLRATIGAAAGLLAVSQAMADDLIQLGADPGKITVHRTGIDRSLFHVPAQSRTELRQMTELCTEEPLLVSVGALIPRKGQVFAIEALAQIPAARLVLIGDGEDRAMLGERAGQMGVADRVHFFGSQPHADIARIVQAADLAVLPSSSEGLANAWIEALACGTPLVITDCGGAREVLNHPAAGQIVDRSVDAIARAIKALLADPPARKAVAACVAEYSWETNGAALVAHWQKMGAAA